MGFTMTFSTDNAAFVEGQGDEVANILNKVAELAREGFTSGPLYDTNGNSVGSWDLTLPPEQDDEDTDGSDDDDGSEDDPEGPETYALVRYYNDSAEREVLETGLTFEDAEGRLKRYTVGHLVAREGPETFVAYEREDTD